MANPVMNIDFIDLHGELRVEFSHYGPNAYNSKTCKSTWDLTGTVIVDFSEAVTSESSQYV